MHTAVKRFLLMFIAVLLFVPRFCNVSATESYTSDVIVVSGTENNTYFPEDVVEIKHPGKINFPLNIEKEGFIFAGWYSDNNYKNPIIDGSNITPQKIFAKWIKLEPKDLIIEGVQIRTTDSPALRFISNITHKTRSELLTLSPYNISLDPESVYFNLTSGIGYGTLVMSRAHVKSSAIEKDAVYSIGNNKYCPKAVPARNTLEKLSDYDRFTAVLTGIDTENYLTNFSARPYLTYTDASGMTRTVYGEMYTTNLYDLADFIHNNSAEPEENRKDIMTYMKTNILEKADGKNNPLSNTYRALKYDKKLTVGYLGGSITFGSSAINDMKDDDGTVLNGDIYLSFANRTTEWFEKTFPDATIEHVNAGISDTATNYANYRYVKDLMNTDGHDLPDIVFVEFTSNDWIYNDIAGKQGHEDFLRQAESLLHNIYAINPYCDVVPVFSTRTDAAYASSRTAYVEVAEHYGLQYIDMGIPVQKLISERGLQNETQGNFYYTVDNLHPSHIGYGIYFDEIRKVLEERLINNSVSGEQKINHLASAPDYMNERLWLTPSLIYVSDLEVDGVARKFTPCGSYMYGMSKDKMAQTNISPDSLTIKSSDTKVRFKFTGTTFSIIFQINKLGINMDYTIDGENKNFSIDKDSQLSFQMADHTQLFVIEQDLPYGEHEVELSFNPTSVGDVNIRIGAIGVAGAQVK